MDVELKQAELIDHLITQASSLEAGGDSSSSASAAAALIGEATSNPDLFAFSDILSVPNLLLQLEGTEYSAYLDILRLFAHGTWSDYKTNAVRLPQLVPNQILKLKQLTVLTLAETNKALPYDQLMLELDVVNVRELEDFLINECMYMGIIRGKLDQLRRCFEVQVAAGRDLRPGHLGTMIATLSDWLTTSDSLFHVVQDKIRWVDNMSEVINKHKKDFEEKLECVKKLVALKDEVDFQGLVEIYSEPGGLMDYAEDRSRPKRRRSPVWHPM